MADYVDTFSEFLRFGAGDPHKKWNLLFGNMLKYGIYKATVDSNKDPDDMGRPKCRFPGNLPNDCVLYATPVLPVNNKKAGLYHVPSPGSQLICQFFSGNVLKPFYIGGWYKQADAPGISGAKEKQTGTPPPGDDPNELASHPVITAITSSINVAMGVESAAAAAASLTVVRDTPDSKVCEKSIVIGSAESSALEISDSGKYIALTANAGKNYLEIDGGKNIISMATSGNKTMMSLQGNEGLIRMKSQDYAEEFINLYSVIKGNHLELTSGLNSTSAKRSVRTNVVSDTITSLGNINITALFGQVSLFGGVAGVQMNSTSPINSAFFTLMPQFPVNNVPICYFCGAPRFLQIRFIA